MAEQGIGCARPTGTVVGGEGSNQEKTQETRQIVEEKAMVQVRVGGKAPDFEAPAYYKGTFTTVKLSNYLGKWILLCFYPGDFTFV